MADGFISYLINLPTYYHIISLNKLFTYENDIH